MDHNLFTLFGAKPLQYPHHTKWYGGKVHVITHPEKLIQPGDTILVGFPSKNQHGEETFSYLEKPAIVTEVLEQRSARGEHPVDFKPVFQLLSIL